MEPTDLYPDLKSAAQAFTARRERISQLEAKEHQRTRGIVPDTIYVMKGTGQACFTPDGEGVVWYDSEAECRADYGDGNEPVVHLESDADFEDLRYGNRAASNARWLLGDGLELGLLHSGGGLVQDAIERHGGRITPQGVVDRDGRAV